MFRSYVFTIGLLGCFSTAFGQCQMPIIMPALNVTPSLMHGTHYNYLTLQPSEVVVNGVLTYTGHASGFYLSGSMSLAESQPYTQFYYDSPSGGQCQAVYAFGFQRNDGFYEYYFYDSSDGGDISLDYGVYLYDDYDHLEITYDCAITDQNLTSMLCNNPDVEVITRVRPDQMSPAERQYVDQAVNATMAKWGCSRADFTEQTWIPSLPLCKKDPTECYQHALQGLDKETGWTTPPIYGNS